MRINTTISEQEQNSLRNINKIRCVTLPAEKGTDEIVLELVEKWGADAIRDCDGTKLSDSLLKLGFDIYSTICLVRADQEWAKSNPNYLPQQFLMSFPKVSKTKSLKVTLLDGYSTLKYRVNPECPHSYWEVIDRTSGNVVPIKSWKYDNNAGIVLIEDVEPFHMYTVNFLAYETWDSVSMYNHIVNNWKTDRIQSVDPMIPEVYAHLMDYFEKWLMLHPDTDVVRLTTLAYNFTLINDNDSKQIFSDWKGYMQGVSPLALKEFARVKGYNLRSEDFVDEGYYNAIYRNPSKGYLDWMDFMQNFVLKFGTDLVVRIHKAGKKAGIFWGDHWVGVEPYDQRYQKMQIDINIGACESGMSLRRIADAPGMQTKEVRLFPYFFPDVFREGGNPTEESIQRWIKIRRAFLRSPIDRIGWGGYLSLAYKFPDFIEHIENLTLQFREFVEYSNKTRAASSNIKVAVLNSWGKLRSWINQSKPSNRFNLQQNIINTLDSNLLECLAGLPIEIEFISFDDIRQNGISKDINIIINDGCANSSWSGGDNWKDAKIVSAIREWVWNGGAFLGSMDATACQNHGSFFQLSDVMGVDKETGNNLGFTLNRAIPLKQHFILNDHLGEINFGVKESFTFLKNKESDVLASYNNSHVLMNTNCYGQGRSVYIAGIPFNLTNCRLLKRMLFWLAKKEEDLIYWETDNVNTEFAVYPETQMACVVNNANNTVNTKILLSNSGEHEIKLRPYDAKWFKI
ncbi:MAG: 1,3-beta-galactosyl-N-acetylhexosamine phosphorylase [Phycisphaerales bacterium]